MRIALAPVLLGCTPTSYLILFGPDATQPLSIAYILTPMLTNVALLAVPSEAFHRERVSAALLLADTVFPDVCSEASRPPG